MNLQNYIEKHTDIVNRTKRDFRDNIIEYKEPNSAGEIVDFYRTYAGLKRHMRALSPEQVEEFYKKGYAFVGAYNNKDLVGIAASKLLSRNDYPYFKLPKNEEEGKIFTLGGLYVREDLQGKGIASKLTKIVTEGTQDYSLNTKDGVGIGYEVSSDNHSSLRVLSRFGNYIGYYNDNPRSEGLSIMLYKPFTQNPVKVERPNIQVNHDEHFSEENLKNGLYFMANQNGIGGLINSSQTLEDGTTVSTSVLNRTPLTVSEPTFELVK